MSVDVTTRRVFVVVFLVVTISIGGYVFVVSDGLPLGSSYSDPDSDVIGWEDGYWHDEPVNVDGGSLNETELRAVVSRSKARVEMVRGVEYTADPEIRVITREKFKQQVGDGSDVSSSDRLRTNIMYKALFMIGENEDAVQVTQSDYASSVDAYYSFESGNITFISSENHTVSVGEWIILQELYHAQQDKQFGISEWEYSTTDSYLARMSVIEGDATYTAYKYQNRYDGSLVTEPDTTNTDDSPQPHMGVYTITTFPYSSGKVFIQSIHTRSGWGDVNDVYENPPNKSSVIIHPDKYPNTDGTELRRGNITTPDGWVVVQSNTSSDVESLGEASLYAMMWYPSYLESHEDETSSVVIPYDHHYNNPSNASMLSYSHEVTSGIVDDAFVPLYNNKTGETGYVWRLQWESVSDAEQFIDSYKKLLTYHGGSKVDDTTYVITTDGFEGVYSITRSGDVVTIVNKPRGNYTSTTGT